MARSPPPPATFTGTSISGAGSAYASSLVVGGDLSYVNGGSIIGGAQVGGANHAPSYMPVSAGLASLPVDFDIENLRRHFAGMPVKTRVA